VYTQYIDMHSDIVISQTDSRPMYLQIMEQVKQRVAVGDWAAGEEIPSIRQLAVALRVSVITVKRAYLELEREGVILTHPIPIWVRGFITRNYRNTWMRWRDSAICLA